MKHSYIATRKTALALAISASMQAGAIAQENTDAGLAGDSDLEEVVVYGRFQQSLINRITVAESE